MTGFGTGGTGGAPPSLSRRLVAAVAPADLVADLDERFSRRVRREGGRSARAWYRRQTVSCLLHGRALRSGSGRRRRSVRAGLGAVVDDLRDAVRSVVRAPGFSLGTAVVLGLGLGASILVFAVTDQLLLRPLPGVREPGRLVSVRLSPVDGEDNVVFPASNPMVRGLARRVEGLSGVAAYSELELHLSLAGVVEPRTLSAQVVTADYFDVLGMRMERGRGFLAREGADPGAARVIVISERLWRQALGGMPDVVGRDLRINGRPFEVIGVAAAGFRGVERPGDTDAWVTLAAHEIVMPYYPDGVLDSAGMTPFFNLVGRLRDRPTLETVSAQVVAAYAALERSLPGHGRVGELRPVVEEGVGLMPGLRRNLERTLAVILVVVAFLLLVTCANFANLLLAHGLRRRRELALRAALGASRLRLVRQRVLVATVLALVGAGLGLVAAGWSAALLRGTRLIGFTAPLGAMQPDLRVAAFALVGALVTGVLFGALPALGLARGAARSLHSGARATAGGRRLRGGLMALQLGVSFALLVAALLATGTLAQVRDVDLGFRPEGVFMFGVQPGLQGLDEAEQSALYAGLLEALRSTAGVEEVSLSWLAPHGRARNDAAVALPGQDALEEGVRAAHNMVSGDFFATLGMRLLRGRGFQADEMYRSGESGVVVISDSLARDLFAETPALGREVTLAWREGALFRVVGVVEDARMMSLTEEAGPAVYEPVGQAWLAGSAWVQVRSGLSPSQVVAAARRVLDELEPGLPVSDPDTLVGHMERRISQSVIVARLSGGFALLAAVLAGAGLFGVLSALVAESRREMGVRAALGATSGALRGLVLLRGLRTAAGGLVLGAILAWWLSRGMAAVLPDARPVAPVHWAGAALLLAAVVLAASLRPAIGAGRLDPMDVLRQE